MSNWRIFGGGAGQWDAALATLSGSNFYQTYAWGEVKRHLGWNVLRLSREDACAQMLVRRYPLSTAVVWIPGGPAGDVAKWANDLFTAVRQHTGARMLYLRLNGLQRAEGDAASLLERAGWRRPAARLGSGLSLLCDIESPEEIRLARASGNWRHNLKRASKTPLRIKQWTNPDVLQIVGMYRAMEAQKGLPAQVSDAAIAAQIDCLGDHWVLMRCDNADGSPIALRAAVIFGDVAWDFLAAATPEARKVYASHATLWELQRACAELGATRYDMGGVDPAGNKGVFDFKNGIGAELIEYCGEWEMASNAVLRYVANVAMRRQGVTA